MDIFFICIKDYYYFKINFSARFLEGLVGVDEGMGFEVGSKGRINLKPVVEEGE